MTDTLRDLLRQDADNAEIPTLDANEVIVQGEQQLHRRRMTTVLAAAAVVAVIAVGGIVAGSVQHQSQGPIDKPTKTHKGQRTDEPKGARPLVYAVGARVHVGDKTVEAVKPVAFIDATDDGAVYEATLDGTLWFTDGTTTSVIGTSSCTACPTPHGGVVSTGDSGSLVVWGDASGRQNELPVEFVVFDTSSHEEVARIPFTEPGLGDSVLYVDEDHVYLNPDPDTPGCWVIDANDIHPCKHPHLFRFDVASGETTKITLADWDAELSTRARMFVTEMPDNIGTFHPIYPGADFAQVGRRLVHAYPSPLALTDGEEVRLRLPSGYVAPGPGSEGGIAGSQWLDDDHIVVFASRGEGDLPGREGDLLVCPLPDGICRVAVPRSSRPYVAP
jgi:hypothetical protein